jgi:hypothetical protein
MRGKPFFAALLGGVFCLWVTAEIAQADLLTNGNLDKCTATEIVPGFFLPKPRNWFNDGTRSITGPYEDEMSSEPWAGPAPTPVTTDGDAVPPDGVGIGADGAVFFKPFSGDAGTTNGLATGHLYQDVSGLPGVTYTLTGWAGAEANALMTDAVFAVEFLNAAHVEIPASGSELSLLPTLYTPNGQPFNYKMYTVTATAPVGTAYVRARASMIGAMSNPAGGGQAFVVDDFTLVPEPASLTVAGFGMLLLAGRGRRRRVA